VQTFSKVLSDEAHLSTEPAGPQAASRFPLAFGDAGRPQGAGEPPRQGPQGAVRLTRTVGRVTARRDYLAANRGKRAATPGFVLIAHVRASGSDMRTGFTVTKKIGNAVVRNRCKRRLRALARDVLPEHGLAGTDHIFIGRQETATRDFMVMRAELVAALVKLSR
jgi:ribonuclease P protein component